MGKSPEEMTAAMIKNLAGKTGKTLPAWLNIVQTSKLRKHGEIVKFLKSKHDVTHGYANLIAHNALSDGDGASASGDELVAKQYAGPKANLLPIYQALIKTLSKLGKDVEIAPKKAYVSIRRNKQFALIQPSTKTRVDVGVNIKTKKPTKRLEVSGSFNTMVSHRVRVSDVQEVDKELLGWLREAYDAA